MDNIWFDLEKIKIRNGERYCPICPFPVGFIYMSTEDVNPARIYGNTWVQIQDGHFWKPSSSYGIIGGSTTIITDNLPSHHHTGTTNKDGAGIWNNLEDILKNNKNSTPRYLYILNIAPLFTTDSPGQIVRFFRVGNIVTLCCEVDHTYNPGNNTILTNIPQGYRPPVSLYWFPATSNYACVARASISNNNFYLYNYHHLGQNNLPIYFTYITTDKEPDIWSNRNQIPKGSSSLFE